MNKWHEYYYKGKKLHGERCLREKQFEAIDLAKQQAKEIRLLKIELEDLANETQRTEKAKRIARITKKLEKERNQVTKKEEFVVSKKQALQKKSKKYPQYPTESSLKKYKLTSEEYANMLAKQKGVCNICGGINKSNRNLNIDHCHVTNKVRALLCNNCNTGLGFFKDNPETLEKAAQYLKIHQKRAEIKLTG